MPTIKENVAKALSPMLSEFHLIGDQPLRSVWQLGSYGSVERLVLSFGLMALIVRADVSDDSVEIAVSDSNEALDGGSDVSHLEPWSQYVGRPFGWGWVSVNQQGYCDGLMMSFGTIVPQIVLNVIASSIKVGAISKLA